MNVLLTPFGSAGDVYPMIGIGSELLRRGHRVTMITNAYFEDISTVIFGARFPFSLIATVKVAGMWTIETVSLF